MEIYGLKNVTDKELNFNYDKHYRSVSLNLKKAKTQQDKNQIKESAKQELNVFLKNIEIDIKKLKNHFIDLILDKKSAKYLWILYSKYEAEENYIDKISNILKLENKVIRGGTNTYKINGWMTHTLYVYQIVNYNIAYNIEISNFNGNQENKKQVEELHNIWNDLNIESKFLLKIFTLIHDIGVIEDVTYHDKLGSKYVEKILQEIGLNQLALNRNNLIIDEKNLIKILQELIKYHTLITSLSSERSDAYVEEQYKNLINQIPDVKNIKEDIPKLLMILAYGDVIAVDESLMDIEKYQRTQNCYHFFEQISQGKNTERNKEKVAIERICDTVGESKVQNLILKFDYIMEDYKMDKNEFIEDMYHIKCMKYTGPLMKSLKDMALTIKIYHELFELIKFTETKEQLKNYTIIFVPDKHENDFVEQIKNGNFFACIKEMKNNKVNESTYGNIKIEKGINEEGKYLYIKVL